MSDTTTLEARLKTLRDNEARQHYFVLKLRDERAALDGRIAEAETGLAEWRGAIKMKEIEIEEVKQAAAKEAAPDGIAGVPVTT